MSPNVFLPFLSSFLSFVFAGLVFDQWLHRRKMHQLIWTVGMLWFGISAGTEFLGGAFGWNLALYRWWYLIGAICVAAYLGLGTIYLLSRGGFGWWAIGSLVIGAMPAVFSGYLALGLSALGVAVLLALVRWQRPAWFAHAFLAAMVAGTLYAAVVVFSAPVPVSALPANSDQIVNGQGFPPYVRIITPLFNSTGGFSLVFGAVYSAYYFWRSRTNAHRMVSNVLIAAGAFIPVVTGMLSRFGMTGTFFIGELLGVLVIFVGFLISAEVFATYRIPGRGQVQRTRGAQGG